MLPNVTIKSAHFIVGVITRMVQLAVNWIVAHHLITRSVRMDSNLGQFSAQVTVSAAPGIPLNSFFRLSVEKEPQFSDQSHNQFFFFFFCGLD